MSSSRREANRERDAVIDQLRREGVRAAYERGIKLLRDDTVAATAQAALVRVMFDAAGVLRPGVEDRSERDVSEMSPEEVDDVINEGMRRLAFLKEGTADLSDEEKTAPGIFA